MRLLLKELWSTWASPAESYFCPISIAFCSLQHVIRSESDHFASVACWTTPEVRSVECVISIFHFLAPYSVLSYSSIINLFGYAFSASVIVLFGFTCVVGAPLPSIQN